MHIKIRTKTKRPISSEAQTTSLRAMNNGSSPPSNILANQYIAPLSLEPRMDFCRAEAAL